MQVRASNFMDGRREAGGDDCCERSLDRLHTSVTESPDGFTESL